MASPQKLVKTALKETTADDCVVIVTATSSANLRWANNTLTTNGVAASNDVIVISFVDDGEGTAAGVVGRGITSRDQVKTLVAEADEAARAAAPADDAAPLVAGGEDADWDAPPASTSIEVFDKVSRQLGAAFRRAADARQRRYGYVQHEVTTTYLGSSTGTRRRHAQPTGFLTMTGKPTDLSTSAWVGQAAENIEDIDVESLDNELARRIGWAARRVDLDPGRYETILPPTAVADLSIYAYWVAGARDAAEGQTAFSRPSGGTRVGEQIARPGVCVRSDPGYPTMTAAPFAVLTSSGSDASVFDNGAALTSTVWIGDGKLEHLYNSRHSAGLTDLAFTPAIGNLIVEVADGQGSTDDLVARTERGLLLTSLWYIREVDPQTLLLTGLTRDGVYLVEDGVVSAAVNNFRFNESPLDLLDRFSEAGASVRSFSREWGDHFPRTCTPPLRIPDFNMSSVSPAS
jgi:predicted Zn-dependent protease